MRYFLLTVSLLSFALSLRGQAPQTSFPANQAGTVPRVIRLAGSVHDSTGTPIIGNVKATFTLYASQNDESGVWQETQAISTGAQGSYHVLLGSNTVNGLPLDIFSSGEARWLGVAVEGQPEQARVLLLSVAYALKAADAETLGGRPLSDFVLTENLGSALSQALNAKEQSSNSALKLPVVATGGTGSSILSPSSSCAAVTSDGTGSANQLSKFTTPCNIENSALFESNGKVGIGNKAPAGTLDVSGSALVRGSLFAFGGVVMPPAGAATTTEAFLSNPLDFQVSVYNTALNRPADYLFRWQSEPTGNDSTNTGATLNLLYGVAGDIAETGVSINKNGVMTSAGAIINSEGLATATLGYNSNPLDFISSAYDSATKTAVKPLFRWQAEPTGNNSVSPSSGLHLLFSSNDGTPIETGLSIASNGRISFAPGQTFPGAGNITQITAGSGLTGGGTSGNVSLSLLKTCSTGQILQWNGTTWACSSYGAVTGSGNGIAYFAAPTMVVSTAPATDGQILIGSSGAAPSLATLTAGPNVSISNAPGSITISAAGPNVLEYFATGGNLTGTSSTAGHDVTTVWGFLLPYDIETTSVTFEVISADNSGNNYDLGIFDNSGNLVLDIGATAGNTFAPKAAFNSLPWHQGPKHLVAGRYYIGFTAHCAAFTNCASIAAAANFVSFAVGVSGPATAGGALPQRLTPPVDVWSTGNEPMIVLR